MQQSISLTLNPFFAEKSASTFDSGMSGEFSNPLYTSDTAAFHTASSPTTPEPNITMDLLDSILSSPMPANPFAPSPPSMQQPYPMASPFQAPQFQAPYGQPQVAGGPMGPPVGVMGPNPFQQPQPGASTDLLSSLPSDSLFGFSQPLQPATIATSAPPVNSGPPPKVDAFADLVSLARNNAPEQSTGATPLPPPFQNSLQQKPYVSMHKMAAEKNQPAPLPTPPPFGQFLLKKTGSLHQPIADNAFDAPSPPTSAGFDLLSPDAAFGSAAVTTGGGVNQQASWQGFDDIFGDPNSASPQKPVQATPASGFESSFGKATSPTQPGWVGFEEEEKGQWL